ncbi:hypothetical protein Emag_004885 [Eimeria magna]
MKQVLVLTPSRHGAHLLQQTSQEIRGQACVLNSPSCSLVAAAAEAPAASSAARAKLIKFSICCGKERGLSGGPPFTTPLAAPEAPLPVESSDRKRAMTGVAAGKGAPEAPPLPSRDAPGGPLGGPGGTSEEGAPSESPAAIPVTIVTGLLGAGKTTLLRRLLKASGGLRLLLVQNEFSEQMGIEAPTLVDATPQQQQQKQQQHEGADGASVALTGDEEGVAQTLPFGRLVELPGGCLCCSLRGELLQALDSLLSLIDSHIDAILIETNGAADPQPIVEALWTDTPLLARTALDGVVCLVDASHPHAVLAAGDPTAAAAAAAGGKAAEGRLEGLTTLESHGGLGIVALKQIALADSILLTKEDAAGEQQLLLLQQQLQKLNPGAPIYRCCNGEAPLHAILGLEAYSGDRYSSSLIGRSLVPMSPEKAAAAAAAQALWEQQQQQQRHDCVHAVGGCHHAVGGLTSVLLSFPLGRRAALVKGSSSRGKGGPFCLFSLQRLQQAVGELLWPEEAADAADMAPAAADTAAAADSPTAADEAKRKAPESAIFRCKGVFTAWKDDSSEDEQDAGLWGVYELQGVGRSFEVRPVDPLSAAAATVAAAFAADGSGESEARFLFVGVSLSKPQLDAKLLGCLTTAEA